MSPEEPVPPEAGGEKYLDICISFDGVMDEVKILSAAGEVMKAI